jgi:CRP-like cAMP-binding protein
LTFDTKGWNHYFRRADRSLSAVVTSLFTGCSLLRIRNSGKGANHDTRCGCQETPQIRSPNISFDHRRKQNHLIVCQKADDLWSGRLVRRFFYIQEGRVRLAVVATSGKEATIGILNEGDFFGQGCLAGQPPACARQQQWPIAR